MTEGSPAPATPVSSALKSVSNTPVATSSPLRSKDVLLPLARVKTIMKSSPDVENIGQESLFLNLLPNAKQQIVEGAGHFLQETHGKLLAQNIITFLNE